jgi:nucleotide-binding universal stress UspA family protein
MRTILAAVDFSEVMDPIIDHAVRMVRAFRCALYLLHVEAPEPDFVGYEPGPQHERDYVAQEHKEHREQMLELRDRLASEGLEVHSLMVQGPTVEKILEEADRLNADLVVVGSHGHGALRHLILGSVSEGVIQDASCAVLVVPSHPRRAI